jgi:putative sugar O-methyltransferase
MSAEVDAGATIHRPSRFWETLSSVNAAQLSDRGFEAFKRTINQNYFNWLITRPWDPQYRSLIADWLRHPTPSVVSARVVDSAGVEVTAARKPAFGSRTTRLAYAVFVAMLWEYVRRRDRLQMLDRLSEPTLGDPILVRHRGRDVSQDIANSVMEFYSVNEAIQDGIPADATVVELGPGYGRLGWLLVSILPRVRYIAVDIPPALAISQEYLTRLFPDLTTVRFQRGSRHLGSALSAARLAFLTPNQLDEVQTLGADVFITISSLHEMRRDQIAHYMGMVDRHTSGIFYMKQSREWTNPRDAVTIGERTYPIPTGWRTIYHRSHPVQTHFFEAAFQIRGS